MSGLSIGQSLRPSVLRETLRTEFGQWWLAQMACALALGLGVAGLVVRRPLFGVRAQAWIAVTAALGVGLAGATAANGHARTVWKGTILVPVLAVHLLAAAVWVGGLAGLVVLAGTRVAHGRR